MHISRRVSLELASLMVALLILVLGLACLRLSRGPVSIDFLRPLVESKFYDRTGDHLQIDHLWLSANGLEVPVTIAGEGVGVSDANQKSVVTVKTITATLSRSGLLAGRIYPITLDVDHPTVMIGDLIIPPPDQTNQKPSQQTIENFLGRLSNPAPGDLLSHWEKISLQDGMVQNGPAPDAPLLATGLNAHLDRTPVGLKGGLHGVYLTPSANSDISGDIEINRGEKGILSFHSAPILLSQLSFLPSLSYLQKIQLPVEASITANLHDTTIADARIDLAIGQGKFIDDAHFPAALDISGGAVELVYQATPERAELRRFDLDLGGPKISATSSAETLNGALTVGVEGKVADLPLDSFDKYWPQGVSKGGRKWVTSNLSDGTVKTATVHVVASGPRDDPAALDISSLTGTIAVGGATIHYFGQLPDVQAASADITYDQDTMKIAMTGGHAENLSIKSGMITIDGFKAPQQTMTIDLDVAGPITAALDIIDHPPLGYAHKLQITPSAVGGSADTRLQMAFPLLNDVSLDQLGLVTQSTLQDVSIPDAVDHKDANAINGTLNADMNGMELVGTGDLGDIPLKLDYKQSFDKNGALEATVSGMLDDRQRGELGFDFPDRLKGPIGVSAHYSSQGKTGTADVAIDLTPAIFNIDEIGYTKPAGQAGSAKFTVSLENGAVQTIDPLTIEAPQFSTTGSARFDPDTGALTTLALNTLKADETDMRVTVTPTPSGGSRIDIAGAEFDARHFLHNRREKQPATPQPDSHAKLDITVDLATVKTSDKSGLTQIKGQLSLDGRKWRRADFTANANGSPVFLSYLPNSTVMYPAYTLHAGAQDAGAALAGFALTDSVKGGVLTINGTKQSPMENQPDPPLDCTLTLGNFRLVNPPGFARLFNLLSVSGFQTAISSSDIHFDSLKAKFQIDNEELRVSDGRLTGDAIGLTIAGTADRDAGTLDLYGTAVPAYGANRILNSIPLLGPLLTGGEGQGVFAATYTIKGPYENPNVFINPLSVFAPGVLRDFLFTPSDPDMSSGD